MVLYATHALRGVDLLNDSTSIAPLGDKISVARIILLVLIDKCGELGSLGEEATRGRRNDIINLQPNIRLLVFQSLDATSSICLGST